MNGMAKYNSLTDGKQKHNFLAKMQGTHKAILSVHSPAELGLFRELMKNNSAFNHPTGLSWKEAVKVWNCHADTRVEISYKVFFL